MIIESELHGQQRDQQLLPKWISQRVDIEQSYWKDFHNPETPVQVMDQYHESMTTLDTFLTLSVSRYRRWGLESEAKTELKMLDDVLVDIRERMS